MIDFYKLENNDIVRLIPITKKDGTLVNYIEVTGIYYENHPIYENDRKYLYKMGLNNQLKFRFKRYFISIYHENLVKFVSVGRNIYDLIKNVDISKNIYLNVKVELVDSGVVGRLPSYENSFLSFINNTDTIPSNIFDIEDFIQKRQIDSVIQNYPELLDMYNIVVANDREDKINIILN